MGSLLGVLYMAIDLYMWMLIISAILSWLVAFNIINTRNQFVLAVGDFFARLTEPALRPIRKFVPLINGVDIAPLVLYFILMFVQMLIRNNMPLVRYY